ncbi:MAG: WD40 repeat domain-containing serine/threonine protein kinase, partial [Planctomycetota bacterium]
MKKRQNGEAYDRLNQEIENWLNQAVDMDGDSPSSRGGGMDTTAIQTPTGLPSTLPREDDPPTHQDGPLKRAFDAMRECVRDTENDFDPPTTAFPNIDGYEVQSVIGRGGMGVVYAARQSGLNRTVAIKCLNLGLASETRARARFEIEVQAAAKLDHPHIVPIYAVGQVPIYAVGRVPIHALGQVPADDNGPVESSPYYAMQRIDGADAQARINRQGRPETPAEIAGVIEGLSNIADAIDHAHQHGIIHRDLKPANLLIDNDGKWWVFDFGLARIQDHQVTGTGDRLGSLRYMSPEQIRGDAVDHRTDVYSLGITLSECLTGRPVVAGDQTSQIIQSVLETRPPLISTLHPAVSLDTARVIQKSVEKDPSDRYATAADFAADLRAAAHGDPIRARPIGIVGRIQRYARRRPRQIALATVASGLVLAMIASAAIYTADRLSKNNRDLRRQYATVMEMNGRQAILSDTPESAASFYRKAAETSPDAGFIQLQRDRLRWIDQMTASMQRSGSIPGRLLDQVRITPKNPAGDGRSILSTANLISIRSAKSTPTTAQSLRLITTSGQGVGGQPSTSESVADFVQPVLTARLNDSADRIAVVTGDPSDSDRTIHLLHRESTTKPLAGDDGPAFKKVAEFKAGRRVLWLSFEGPSDDLLVTGWSGYLRRHDSQTGRLIQQSPLGPDDESTRVNWVYNARSDRSKTWLALATSPGHVQVYRRSDGSPVFASPPKLPSLYNDALAIDDAGKWLAIGDNAGHLTMFSLQNPERAPRTFKASSPIVDLAIEPKTDRIVVATGDRRVQLVSLQTGRRLTRTFEHPRLIQGLRISPDGQALAVFGGERLRLHSLSTGEPLSSLLRCAPDLIQIRWENRRDPDDAIPLGQRDIVRGVSGGLNRLRTLHRDQASNQTIQQSWRLPIWKEN